MESEKATFQQQVHTQKIVLIMVPKGKKYLTSSDS